MTNLTFITRRTKPALPEAAASGFTEASSSMLFWGCAFLIPAMICASLCPLPGLSPLMRLVLSTASLLCVTCIPAAGLLFGSPASLGALPCWIFHLMLVQESARCFVPQALLETALACLGTSFLAALCLAAGYVLKPASGTSSSGTGQQNTSSSSPELPEPSAGAANPDIKLDFMYDNLMEERQRHLHRLIPADPQDLPRHSASAARNILLSLRPKE